MHKLYLKSELRFAIIWIIIYVVGTCIADGVSKAVGIEKSITLIFLVLLCSVVVRWMKQNGLYE